MELLERRRDDRDRSGQRRRDDGQRGALPGDLDDHRPDATRTWIDGAGHYPQNEDPAAYLAALEQALG